MIVNIGSKNPNKFNAVKEAFLLFEQFQNACFESIAADSEISNQPVGFEETITGAANRSKNAFLQCAFSVGLESGLVPIPLTRTGYMNLSVCVIYNGKELYTGISPAFELPDNITKLVIHEKLELDEAILKSGLSANPRIGYSEGIIGVLTDGVVTRKDYMLPAVTMAMAQLLPTLK
jgi:inosine/xanthosine triphosphatase